MYGKRQIERPLGPDEVVDLASMDSFPASDAPPWAATHAGTPGPMPPGPDMFYDLVQRLHDDVRLLSEEIGERHERTPRALVNLSRAADAIHRRLEDAKLPVKRRPANETADNIEAVLAGRELANESVVVGAHYDSPVGSPGADDNASGVAVLLSLAHALQHSPLKRTVRLVAFAAEQPPHAGTESMGSARYLRELQRQGPCVVSMMSLESLGLYMKDLPWPLRLVPTLRSDVLFIGDRNAARTMARAKEAFDHAGTGIVVSALSSPLLFANVRTSDHWPFAREGIPSFMVTDTAPLWASHYHGPSDTAERLDFERLGCTTLGVAAAVRALADA